MKCSVTLSSTIVFVSPQSASLLVPPVNCNNSSSPIPMQEKNVFLLSHLLGTATTRAFECEKWKKWQTLDQILITVSRHIALFFRSSRNNQTNNAVEVPRKCENNYWPLQMCTGSNTAARATEYCNRAVAMQRLLHVCSTFAHKQM